MAGQAWTLGSPERRERRAARRRSFIAVAAAFAELVLLAWLMGGSAFQVREVRVQGNHALTRQQVIELSGLQRPGSVFALDAASIRRKLTASSWVRDASVDASLPNAVTVTVAEWSPVAVFQGSPTGRPFLLSSQAVVLGPAPAGAPQVLVIGTGGDPRIGARPIDAQLLTALVNIQRGLPVLIGQDVASFSVDGCGNLVMNTRRGWRALFGRVITPEEYAALDQKLAALKSISTHVDYNNPDLAYVNVMNPAEAAVGYRSAQKPAPSPSSALSPSPSPADVRPQPVPVSPCR